MTVSEVFAGVPVADYPAARAWYERLVGRPADFCPNDREAVWQLAEHAFIYVVRDPARAGTGLLTLLVDDLDRHLAELADRGVATGAIDTVPETVRKSAITDPDGNRITLGQPL